MNVLVIGGGGREHALAWALSRSDRVKKVYIAPGNAGCESVGEVVPIPVSEAEELARFAHQAHCDLTVVGPEAPLVAGISDLFRAKGKVLFGPDKKAARLEGSKCFAKDFMKRHHVPTADCVSTDDPGEARAAVRSLGGAVVIKADGLAAGKGVFLPDGPDEADEIIDELMIKGRFGDSGRAVVVEQRLEGRELSVMIITDGDRYLVLPTARDYKRLRDGDEGPNTGGMGVFSPGEQWTDELSGHIREEIINRTLWGMRAEGSPYIGVLYAGLMLTDDGPMVLEYNCRFGDPETQAVLPRLIGDFAELLYDVCHGELRQTPSVSEDVTVGVVMASEGYPDRYEVGKVIAGLDEAAQVPGVTIFHAGTARRGEDIIASGGRVLCAVGRGKDREEARRKAYQAVSLIRFDGATYRSDIGRDGQR